MTITQRVVRRARSAYGVEVLTQDQWGSKARRVYAWRRTHKPVTRLRADTLVQHITVTLDTGPLTGDFKRDVQTVERIGLERFGSGVSYNFVVDMRTGKVAVGMPLDAKGTHTVNEKRVPGFSYDQNAVARAIAVLGMENTPLSEKAVEAIAGLIAAMMDVGALTQSFDYEPHSKFANKACPCTATRNRMGDISRRARALRAAKRAPSRVQQARVLLDQALALLRQVPSSRRAAHRERQLIEEALARMPRR